MEAVERLPKTTPLRFCSVRDGVREAASGTAGKILLVSDGGCFRLAEAAQAPKTLCVVLEGDALPLFAMADEVGCVIAAGGKQTLWAARYFAQAVRARCVLFPDSAALDGAYERFGCVLVGGERCTVPLGRGEVLCDMSLVRPTLARGYCRLLLAWLAAFEARAAHRLDLAADTSLCERAVGALGDLSDGGGSSVILRNAALRGLEGEGFPTGEGSVLAEALGGEFPEWGAVVALTALYGAFFSRGRPSGRIPDYRARARASGVPYRALAIPTPEQYARRALLLERARAQCLAELATFKAAKSKYFDRVCGLAGAAPPAFCGMETLKYLPERGGGLSALIRDFGLMEF